MSNVELQHYGVMGMRWGVRKDNLSARQAKQPSARKARRDARNAEIKGARDRQAERYKAFQESKAEYFMAKTRKGEERAIEFMRKRENELFNNPDVQTANMMNSGERWGVSLLSAGTAALVAATALSAMMIKP